MSDSPFPKVEKALDNKALELLDGLENILLPNSFGNEQSLDEKMLTAMLGAIKEHIQGKPIQWQFNMPHPKIALIGAGKVSQEDLCACHDQFDTLIELGEPGMRGKAWVAVAKTPVEGIEVQFLETFVPCTWH
jgi:hypothetical protein